MRLREDEVETTGDFVAFLARGGANFFAFAGDDFFVGVAAFLSTGGLGASILSGTGEFGAIPLGSFALLFDFRNGWLAGDAASAEVFLPEEDLAILQLKLFGREGKAPRRGTT